MKGRVVILAAIALMAASCLGKNTYYKATSTEIADFEYTDLTVQDFGQDSLYVPKDEAFAGGGCMAFFNTKKQDGTLDGGCALTIGCDPRLREGYVPLKPWLVFLPKKSEKDNTLMVLKFSDSMPEKTAIFFVPSEKSTASPSILRVNNCVQMVNAVRFGTGLTGGPFVKDDWVKLTIKGLLKGNATGSAEVALADFKTYQDSVVTTWTNVDLSGLGVTDQLEFELTSSRTDIPRYVCMDDFLVKLNVEY